MRNLPLRKRTAFTLVEALAVVTVVGIILPVALYGINISQSAASVVTQRARALEVASNQLNLAIAEGTWSRENSGDEPQQNPQFHWTMHAQEWTDSTATNLHEVKVEVTWTNGARTRSVSLSTMVYDGGTGTQ